MHGDLIRLEHDLHLVRKAFAQSESLHEVQVHLENLAILERAREKLFGFFPEKACNYYNQD